MKEKLRFTLGALILAVMLMVAYATTVHAQSSATKKQRPAQTGGFTTQSTPLVPVTGNGTFGQLTKWIGINPSSGFVLGDSIITETAQGQIGIGTTTPTSTLTVAGTIEATEGFKFPDGTTQTTAFDPNKVVRSLNGLRGDLALAAGTNITVTPSGGNTLTIAAPDVLTSVSHNATLTGNGTTASPLGIADGGVGTTQLAGSAVTAAKIAAGNVVKGVNGLTDQVTLAAGSGITLTPVGNTLTIASTAADSEKNAFQRSVTIKMFGDTHQGSETIDVPSGKRLVIEYVTIAAGIGTRDVDDEDLSDISITTVVDGKTVTHNIPHGHISIFANSIDKLVRIYSDADVIISAQKDVDSGSVLLQVSVSGRLIDLP